MPFAQPQENKPVEKTEEEKIIQERIAFAQERLDAISEDLARAEEDKKAIEELSAQKDKLAGSLVSLKKEMLEKQKLAESISASVLEARDELDVLKVKIKEQGGVESKLKNRILKLEQKSKELQEANKVVKADIKNGKDEIERLNSSIESVALKLTNETNNLADIKEELSTLVLKKQELDDANKELVKTLADLRSTQNSLTNAKQQVVLMKELAVDEVNKGKQKAADIVKKAKDDMKNQGIMLDNREARLSKRELYVEDKVKRLIAYKLHLEKHSGKQFKDLVIE